MWRVKTVLGFSQVTNPIACVYLYMPLYEVHSSEQIYRVTSVGWGTTCVDVLVQRFPGSRSGRKQNPLKF